MIDLKEFIGATIVSEEIERRGKKETFYFAELSAAEAEDIFVRDEKEQKNIKRFRGKVVAAVLRTADGQVAMTATEASQLPNQILTDLFKVSLRINGMGDEDKAEAKKE